LLISAFSLAYGISQVPAGWLADRIGARILLTVSVVGVGATGVFVGLSHTYLMLIAGLILMGILSGGYHPTSPTLIASAVEPTRRGWALGLHMIGGSVCFFLAPVVAAALAAALGWRGPYIILAIPSILFGIFFYIILTRRIPNRAAELKAFKVKTDAAPMPSRMRRLVAVIVLSTFIQSSIISVVSFIPLFLVDQYGASKGLSAAAVSIVYSGGLWAAPLGGYISDRIGRILVSVLVSFGAAASVILLNYATYGAGMIAVLILIGAMMYFNTTVAQAYLVDHTPERSRSTILGLYFFGTAEGSGILTPLIGYLIDSFNFYTAFAAMAGGMLVVSVVCFFLLRDNWKE
jgi:MFS family permease